MRHYIYLEEQRIIYLLARRGTKGAAGAPAVITEARDWEPRGADLGSALKQLSARQSLSGKKVTLALGRDLFFLSMALPKGKPSVVRRMALNQLTMEDGFPWEPAGAVDFWNSSKKGVVHASLFYMEEKRFTGYKNAVAAAGMVCSHVIAVPHCMALAAQELWKERSLLVVDAEEDQLGIYLVSKGHCLASKITALKARRFCLLNGEPLLYEEIAEQAQFLMKRALRLGTEYIDIKPECVAFMGCCLPFPEKGAACLEKILKIPCFARNLGEASIKNGSANKELAIPSGLLAVCMADVCKGKGRPAHVYGRTAYSETSLSHGIFGILSRGWVAFLLANTVAALGLGIWTGHMEQTAAADLADLRSAYMGDDYRKDYQAAAERKEFLEKLVSRSGAYESVKEAASNENLLGMTALKAFTEAMEPDMEVESIVFEGNNETLSMVISMSNREQIPLYVERVRQSGLLPNVSHSLWERKEEEGAQERIFAAVSASLRDGGQHETQ